MKRLALIVVGVAALASFKATAQSPATHTSAPTFAKDVAPIMFNKCANCHRPGEVAPMSLLSYEDARPWAKAIKAKVVAREMPPWGADMTQTLADAQRHQPVAEGDRHHRGVGRWRRGDAATLPTCRRRRRSPTGWTHGTEPDFVLEMPVEFDIPAEGEIGVQMFYSKVPWTEDRFAGDRRAASRATARAAPRRHLLRRHSRRRLARRRPHRRQGRQDHRRSRLARAAVAPTAACPDRASCCRGCRAAGSIIIAPNIGKRIPAGKYINWQLHYNPTGKPQKDRTKLGIWFNKVPVTHEVLIRQAGDPLATTKGGLSIYRAEGREVEYKADPGSTRRSRTTPNIPPYAENWRLTGITPVTEDITLYAMSPHMHLRGKSLKWVIVYPDGREQTILNVPKFDFNWQFNYELEGAAEDSGRQQDPRASASTTTRSATSGTPARTSRCTGRSRAGTRCISRSPSTRWTRRT